MSLSVTIIYFTFLGLGISSVKPDDVAVPTRHGLNGTPGFATWLGLSPGDLLKYT